MEYGHYHQVGNCEKPFPNRRVGCNGHRAKVFCLDQAAKVLGTNSGQVDRFFFGEELLT
jgi:hypothetical protein